MTALQQPRPARRRCAKRGQRPRPLPTAF